VRSLQIREQQLGADHPTTAISLWNLAVLYYDMKRIAEAKPLIDRAVAIFDRTLDKEHPIPSMLVSGGKPSTTLNSHGLPHEEQIGRAHV